MYEYITGTVTDIGIDHAVIDAGGIGYFVNCSSKTLAKLVSSEKARLFLYLHIADDAMQLYGFHSKEEREMFKKLISVSRIGKKTAQSVLSVLTPQDIALAVNTDNAAAFDAVPGMGRKTAQRVILELKEKVTLDIASSADEEQSNDKALRSGAIEALLALGFDGITAGRAVSEVKSTDFNTVEELIKKALAIASGRNV